MNSFIVKQIKALLVKNRGINTNIIQGELDNLGIKYFYALFKDNDSIDNKFHNKALNYYLEVQHSNKHKLYSKKAKYVLNKLKEKYKDIFIKHPSTFSLYKLLELFFNDITSETSMQDELNDRTIEVFINKSLNNYLRLVDDNLVISTIHGAKGLEWDNVILADTESKTVFTSSCWNCNQQNNETCEFNIDNFENPKFAKGFKEDLSLFYVGVTRAKKNIYFTYSNTSYTWDGKLKNTCASCFLQMLMQRTPVVI